MKQHSGGRKPYPFKHLKGTERGTDHEEAPVPEETLPEVPDDVELPDAVVKWFNRMTERLEAMNCASKSHTEMLVLLAKRLAEIDECDKNIVEHGYIYESTTDRGGYMLKGNPAVSQRSEAMRHAHSLLTEFGLSLSAVMKVKVPKKDKKSTWGSFGESESA